MGQPRSKQGGGRDQGSLRAPQSSWVLSGLGSAFHRRRVCACLSVCLQLGLGARSSGFRSQLCFFQLQTITVTLAEGLLPSLGLSFHFCKINKQINQTIRSVR